MEKLVNSHALGACAVKSLSVRVRPRAPLDSLGSTLLTTGRSLVVNQKLFKIEKK